MGDLIKPQNVVLANSSLSTMVKDVYRANTNISISKIQDKNLVVKSIHSFVNQTIMDKGVNLETEEINYIKTRVVDDIMKEFSSLSIEDIKLAFYYGVRGQFGEYYGINPISFFGWMKYYKNELLPKVNLQVSPLLLKSEKTQEPEVDQRFFESELCKTVLQLYFNLCVHGVYDFNDIGNIHYKFLVRNNLVSISEEQDSLLNEKAKQNVMKSLSEHNSNMSKQGKVYHKIKLSDALQEIENGENNNFSNQIQIEKMKLAFYYTLYRYAENETDLYVILKDKIV